MIKIKCEDCGNEVEFKKPPQKLISSKFICQNCGLSKKGKKKYAQKITTLVLNNKVLEKLSHLSSYKRSAWIDMVLSEHFGISYEEAYPDAFLKSYGEKRRWDVDGLYRKLDIENPARFSSRQKRKKLVALVKSWRMQQK